MRLLDDAGPGSDALIGKVAAMEAADRQRVLELSGQAGEPAQRNVAAAVVRARFAALEPAWLAAARPPLDLETALTVISATAAIDPGVDIKQKLDQYADEAGKLLSGDRAFDAGLGALHEVLFRRHGLRGNDGNYYAPENSQLGWVLATGLGIPISLCSVALLVGRRLELPVFGVGAPGHFLGFYGDVDLRVGSFFDPFDGFQRLTAGQLQALLGQFVERVESSMLNSVSDTEIVARHLRNLAGAYKRMDQPEYVRNLERWNQLLVS